MLGNSETTCSEWLGDVSCEFVDEGAHLVDGSAVRLPELLGVRVDECVGSLRALVQCLHQQVVLGQSVHDLLAFVGEETGLHHFDQQDVDGGVPVGSGEDVEEQWEVVRQRDDEVDVVLVELERGLDQLQQLDVALVDDLDLHSDGVAEGLAGDSPGLDLGQDVLEVVDEGLVELVLLVLSLLLEELGELGVGRRERSHDHVSSLGLLDTLAHQQGEHQVQDVCGRSPSVFVVLQSDLHLRFDSS